MVEISTLQYQLYVSINTSGKILICRVFTLTAVTFTVPNCENAPSLSTEPLHGNIGTGSGKRFWRELSGTESYRYGVYSILQFTGLYSQQVSHTVYYILSFHPSFLAWRLLFDAKSSTTSNFKVFH